MQVRAQNDAGESGWSASGAESTDENNAPEAAGDAVTTGVGQAITIAVLGNDTDADGDALTVESVTAPSNGSAAVSGTAVAYTPNASYIGVDTFDYTVSDGTDEDTATVTVTVSPFTSNLRVLPNPSTGGSYTVSWTVTAGAIYPLEESTNGGTSWTRVYSGTDESAATAPPDPDMRISDLPRGPGSRDRRGGSAATRRTSSSRSSTIANGSTSG